MRGEDYDGTNRRTPLFRTYGLPAVGGSFIGMGIYAYQAYTHQFEPEAFSSVDIARGVVEPIIHLVKGFGAGTLGAAGGIIAKVGAIAARETYEHFRYHRRAH